MVHLKFYKPRKIWYVEFNYYKEFEQFSLINYSANLKDVMGEIEDNEPTKSVMTGYKFNKYFRKFLLEKFGEIK